MLKKPWDIKLAYIVALGTIILLLIITQVVTQIGLKKQSINETLLTLSEQESLLRQKVTRTSIIMHLIKDDKEKVTYYKNELKRLLSNWGNIHKDLQNENIPLKSAGIDSATFENLFRKISHFYQKILRETKQLAENPNYFNSQQSLETILVNEEFLLEAMNEFVFQYEKEVKAEVNNQIVLQRLLAGAILLLIFFEFTFIFHPNFKRLGLLNSQLLLLNAKFVATSNKLLKKEKRLKEVQYIGKIGSWELDILSGKFSFSDEFLKIFEFESDVAAVTLRNLLGMVYPDDHSKVQKALRSNFSNQIPIDMTVRLLTKEGQIKYVLAKSKIICNTQGEVLLMTGTLQDITVRKDYERLIFKSDNRKTRRRKQKKRMKLLAILEGEEKERIRVSMELHDGVGQLITAMKINLKAAEKQNFVKRHQPARDLLTRLSELLENTSQEITRISNNLTPKLLNDFGLLEAIRNLADGIFRRTSVKADINILLGKKRYGKQIETFLFRIVQEILNNVRKHSEANRVNLKLMEKDNYLLLEVKDNGKGFDLRSKNPNQINTSGLMNLRRRIQLLKGDFNIYTAMGKGCEIFIKIPLD